LGILARGYGSTDRSDRAQRTKKTEDQCSPVGLELARLLSSLVYGTRAILVLNLPASDHTAYDHGNAVRMAKSRPRKNQSESSDLPHDYHALV